MVPGVQLYVTSKVNVHLNINIAVTPSISVMFAHHNFPELFPGVPYFTKNTTGLKSFLSVQLSFTEIRQSALVSIATDSCYEDVLWAHSIRPFSVSCIYTNQQMGPKANIVHPHLFTRFQLVSDMCNYGNLFYTFQQNITRIFRGKSNDAASS